MNKKDYLIMAVIAFFSMILYFSSLGELTAPQTYWQPSEVDEYVTFDLGKQTELDKLVIYGGVNDSRLHDRDNFSIEYEIEDGFFAIISNFQVDLYKVLRWNPVSLNIKTSKIRLKTKVAGGTINEIAFYETGSNSPINTVEIVDKKVNLNDRGNAYNLIDEQDTIPGKYTYLTGSYFDEAFHVRTAYEFLHGMTPFENTHPPLGKIIISIGIAIFGAVPFGWRCMGALFGVLNILIMYRFGKKIFKKTAYATICGVLMMFDFMNFTQSRIGLIDVYAVFFILMMYYYMYDYFSNKSYNLGFKRSMKPLILCGLFFGMGVACKWIVLFGAPGLAALFIWSKYNEYRETRKIAYMSRTAIICVLFFIIIPGCIYIISYIPFIAAPGNNFGSILQNQIRMITYHGAAVRSHPFQSSWFEWPFMTRPIWYYKGVDVGPGMISSIVAMGNPAIWWTGILTFFSALYLSIKNKHRYMAVIFVAAAFQYLVWALIRRTVFIYHFYSTVPFVIFTIVYIIKHLIELSGNSGKRRIIVITGAYIFVVIALFVWFYPVISGLEVSKSWIDSTKWFRDWVFYPQTF